MTGRRLLVATVVANYPAEPEWNRPGLMAANEEIIRLFTGTFGYTHLSEVGLNPTADQLVRQLRLVCLRADPDDHLVVYIAGHGETLEATHNREHVFLTSDTEPDDIAGALRTAVLARTMLQGTKVQRLMLLLDTCQSGRGGDEAAGEALTKINREWDTSISSGFVVITSSQPAEEAKTGAFPELLSAAIDNLATAGKTPSTVSIAAVVTAMNDNAARPRYQQIGWSSVAMTGELPDFLPNPRHLESFSDIDLYLQRVTEWEAQAELREAEYRRRFLVRAKGGLGNEPGWWFTGRHQALTEIADWLRKPDPERPGLAVTGGPGSGKTAVLGLVCTLADKERRRSAPLDTLNLPDVAIPPVQALNVAIYASGLSSEAVLAGLAAAADLQVDSVAGLIAGLANRKTPLTALIDALDEATDPSDLVAHLLTPLLRTSDGHIRLLLGSRPHLLSIFGPVLGIPIGLDDERYADDQALTAYAVQGLIEAAEDSPYLRCSPALTQRVAAAVAAAAAPSFLVARIVSNTLAAEQRPADPSDPAWRATLPQLPGEAMRADLESRLGGDAERARDLLIPLAFAQGQGLPWENIWAPLASRISGNAYTDQDIIWLRRTAGSYVVEATEFGRSAYRLYHQALTEYLRSDMDQTRVAAAFFEVLIGRVPRTVGGGRDWARSHPYSRRYLATHAEHADRIDELIGDADYLLYADLRRLIPVTGRAHTIVGRQRARLLRRTPRAIDKTAPERISLFSMTEVFDDLGNSYGRHSAQDIAYRGLWGTGGPRVEVTVLSEDTSPVQDVCASNSGDQQLLASIDSNGIVRLWDPENGDHLRSMNGGNYGRALIALTVGGREVLASASDDGGVHTWDPDTGARLNTLTTDGANGLCAMTVDEQQLLATASSAEATVQLWDLSTGRRTRTLTGHTGFQVLAVCEVTVGTRRRLVSAGEDGTVRIWDPTSGDQLRIIDAHEDPPSGASGICQVTVDDRKLLASAGEADGTVRLWDPATGLHLRTFEAHARQGPSDYKTQSARGICTVTVDGRELLATAGEDGWVRLWDPANGEPVRDFKGHIAEVTSVCEVTVNTHQWLASSGKDGKVRLWDPLADEPESIISRNQAADTTAYGLCGVTADGRPLLASFGQPEGALRFWNPRTGELERTIDADIDGGLVCAVTVDERNLLATGGSSWVRLWDPGTGDLVRILEDAESPVMSMSGMCAATVDGRALLAVADRWDGMIRTWDAATAEQVWSIKAHENECTVCTITVGERQLLASVGGDGTDSLLWDLATGEQVTVLEGAIGRMRSMCAAALDGHQFLAAAGAAYGSVWLWDLTKGAHPALLEGHAHQVNALCALTVGGRELLATVSDGDSAIKLWDPNTERCITTVSLPRPPQTIASIRANELVVAGADFLVTLELSLPG